MNVTTEMRQRKFILGNDAVTYIVHASKGDHERTTVRLSAVAIVKVRALANAGWQVFITGPDGTRLLPFEFDELSLSQQAIG